MMTTPKKFHLILGRKPWKVWKGFGSFLLFEFGERHKDPKGNVYGSYTLWIHMADWRIRRNGDELAHSECSDAKIERAAAALTGQKIEAVTLDTVVVPRRVRYGARLFFADGYRLDVYTPIAFKRPTRLILLRTGIPWPMSPPCPPIAW
jgi:hypothetical protein